MSTGLHAFGRGIDVSACRCYQIADRINWVMVARSLGYEMGMHPSVSIF